MTESGSPPGRRSGSTQSSPIGRLKWLVVSLLLHGCWSLHPYPAGPGELILLTGTMREHLHLQDGDLRGLRFYLSAQLVLELAEKADIGQVVDSRLHVRTNRSERRVIVTPHVPGRVERTRFVGRARSEHCMEVSFEAGHPLVFCTHQNGPYRLIETAERNLWQRVKDYVLNQPVEEPMTRFLGRQWLVVDGVGVRLLVERNSFGRFIREGRVLKGIR